MKSAAEIAAAEGGSVPPASPAGELTELTVLESRPGVATAFEQRAGAVAILTSYNEMKGPPAIGPALQFVCGHARFRVGHLPGLRDAASRAVLARRLIREGYLRVAADQSSSRAVSKAESSPPKRAGSLVVAGSGIKGFAQMTVETLGWLDHAEVVMYCLSDPATGAWMRRRYPSSIDLAQLYDRHLSRFDVYDAMVAAMLAPVREGKRVCSIYYGHPGVFVMPTHRAVQLAREEGYEACMLPGVSATDCLYAELGSDPSAAGCQYYEATDLLVHRRPIHPENNVVVWQIGVVGNTTSQYEDNAKLPILIEYLLRFYDPDCEVLHYQGSVFPGCASVVERLPLRELGQGAKITTMSTLYIPAQAKPEIDLEMAWRLGLVRESRPPEETPAASLQETAASPPADPAATRRQPKFGPLVQFFFDSAHQPGLLLELDRDPRAASERAGLSADETAALLSRMPGRIWGAIESA